MRKICIVTGTRAEWGLLSRLAKLVRDRQEMLLEIIVTNMHLSPRYGLTCREIEADGFSIDRQIPMLLENADDTPAETVRASGRALTGYADCFETLKPDLLLLLGDRYEILAAAFAALLFGIPIAHWGGGDLTEGAYDDAIRHAVTKMSNLHFTTTEEYRQRVIRMGEEPERVFCVGAPGVENALTTPLLSRPELEESLHFELGERSLLVTYHPETRSGLSPEIQVDALLRALAELPEYRIIFTQPNSDAGGKAITARLEQFTAAHPQRTILFPSLGQRRYLSALSCVTAVVGNSSSGLIEAPSFGIPTLDIGGRQRRRQLADSVLQCGAGYGEISAGLREILSEKFRAKARRTKNPYEQPDTSEQVYRILRDYPLEQLSRKHFYNLEEPHQ